MPTLSHLVSGKVFDIYGAELASATVTISHSSITPSISVNTDSNGEYIINLAGLSSQWSVGDTLTITASKSEQGTITVTREISSGGGQTENLTLAETSDFTFEVKTSNLDRYPLILNIPLHYDGGKITRERGLPVNVVLERQFTQRMHNLSNGQVQYLGWADPGSSISDAVWRIQKLIYGDGNTKPPTAVIWADGDQNFDNIWDNRTSIEYS